MLPARDLDLAFPRRAELLQGDGAVHERWPALRNSQGQVLKHNLESPRSTRDLDVEVTMRALPFTSPVKLYLLNGTEALFVLHVEKREELIKGSPIELFDHWRTPRNGRAGTRATKPSEGPTSDLRHSDASD